MDRKLNIKIGQEVAARIEVGSNVARRLKVMNLDNIDEWCLSGEVTKVGRKYITVKLGEWEEEQFIIENDYRQKYDCGGADYKLYLSKEDVIKDFKAEQLYSNIRNSFDGFNNDNKFTLNQLERIMNIINENK